jgi:hypothetical protein
MTPEYGDEYTWPARHLSHPTVLSSIEELDADRVPEGLVASRILRLQRLTSQDRNTAPPSFSTRDRDGESSGWGRCVEGEVRLLQPASRINSLDVSHGIPRRAVSSYLRRPSALSAIPETNTVSSVCKRPPAAVLQSPSRMDFDSSPDPPPSTASSRREDARQILQEHRISLPPG